jgi:hypothetical protein
MVNPGDSPLTQFYWFRESAGIHFGVDAGAFEASDGFDFGTA